MKKSCYIVTFLFMMLLALNLTVNGAEIPEIEEPDKEIPKAATVTRMVDVSKWDGRVNWKKVKKAGINHTILRIGYGKRYGKGGYSDYMFSTNYKSAKKNKMKCGVYFFSYAKTASQARAEAKYCLKLMKRNKITPKSLALPVVFDLEYAPALKTGRENCTKMTVAFCETIKKAGYDPMVYTSGLHYNRRLDYDKIKQYKIWVANYKVNGPIIKNPYDMWQYTSTGRVPGIRGYCDISYMYSHYVEPSDIQLSTTDVIMKRGEQRKIKATIIPSTATNKRLIWTSSNPKVVKVTNDQTGKIEAKRRGRVYLTVKTASGVKRRVMVTVK